MSHEKGSSTVGTPRHLWIVGVLGVLWNLMGAFDYVMTQTRTESYMSRFTPQQLEYFYAFPRWATAFWAIAVWGGVVGTALLLVKKRQAAPILLTSLVAMIVTSVYNFVLSSGLEVMGRGAVAFSILIFLAALGLWLYARAMTQRRVLV